jgi:AraC-like DNA-binding protein
MNLITIFLVAALFGFVLVSMLLIKKSVNRTSTLFLAAFYLFISVSYLQTYVIESGLLSKMSWFYAWPLPLYTLIPVTLFFYFVTSFNDRFQWKPVYFLLFIPWLISSIDGLQFYLKSSDFRAMIIQNAILHTEDRFNASYGFFALKIHFLIKNLAGLMMMFALLPSLIRFLRIRKNDKNKQLFNRWLLMLWILFTLNSIVWVIWGLTITDLMPVVMSQSASQLLVLFFSMVVLLMGIAPLYFPTILYGFPIYGYKQEPLPSIKASETKQHSITELETEHRFGFVEQEMVEKLQDIEKQQLFLSHDFDIAALAHKMELPVHHLSYFLNQYYETSFAAYRNKLRMEHAVQLINEKYLDQNTIEALSWTCGFASRTSFSKTFKSFIGFSPKEYYEKQ